eukprot:2618246-Rhodomonas_salina.4
MRAPRTANSPPHSASPPPVNSAILLPPCYAMPAILLRTRSTKPAIPLRTICAGLSGPCPETALGFRAPH